MQTISVAGNAAKNSEVISETEDETQELEPTMPNAHTPEELFEEIEGLGSDLKTSRAKDERDCEKLQHILSHYKEACGHCEKRKVQIIADKLCKTEELLNVACGIIVTVVNHLNHL